MECKSVGDRVRELRKQRGLTIEAFASVIGTSRASVVKLESGRYGKAGEKYVRIAKALNCRIDDLFPEMDGYTPGQADDEVNELDELDL